MRSGDIFIWTVDGIDANKRFVLLLSKYRVPVSVVGKKPNRLWSLFSFPLTPYLWLLWLFALPHYIILQFLQLMQEAVTVSTSCLPTISESYPVEYQLVIQKVAALNELWQTLFVEARVREWQHKATCSVKTADGCLHISLDYKMEYSDKYGCGIALIRTQMGLAIYNAYTDIKDEQLFILKLLNMSLMFLIDLDLS